MDVTITKDLTDDHILIVRADGSRAETRFPKKGPVPHDAVHFIVEEALGLTQGFWGMIARGINPDEVQEIAKAAGHASAKRAEVPDGSIVMLVQAERIVESVEAALWSGGTDVEGTLHLAESGCGASLVPVPAMDATAVEQILRRVRDLHDEWVPAPLGHQFQFHWSPQ
jgi:hypothetical protein